MTPGQRIGARLQDASFEPGLRGRERFAAAARAVSATKAALRQGGPPLGPSGAPSAGTRRRVAWFATRASGAAKGLGRGAGRGPGRGRPMDARGPGVWDVRGEARGGPGGARPGPRALAQNPTFGVWRHRARGHGTASVGARALGFHTVHATPLGTPFRGLRCSVETCTRPWPGHFRGAPPCVRLRRSWATNLRFFPSLRRDSPRRRSHDVAQAGGARP
jgi:hypothetical protein